MTGMAGSTLTVVRGYDGSTAVSHAAQAPIRHGITAEDLTLSRATRGVDLRAWRHGDPGGHW